MSRPPETIGFRILLQHSPDYCFIDKFLEAIDAAPSRLYRDKRGKVTSQKNSGYREWMPDGSHNQDRRNPVGPEIKESGYKERSEYRFEVFRNKFPEVFCLAYATGDEKGTNVDILRKNAGGISKRDLTKGFATALEWFIGRTMYHFGDSIDSFHVENCLMESVPTNDTR
ncbi:hypothetical protein Pla52o_52440 [Novipirellula galeiformis]|uniref:Uncharacterized protein n=1 Tax=Novipirellula galeiformis TaxID=2528004 RepID=A0A5C6BYN3_9BACT|nr:hypothetical protein [Novipirellula galeiformis]TWU17440.1 hypothetical protein Pla52o_52440 [Novipirellula galeiformis]